MDRRQRGKRVAHSQVGGGFTILRNWGAGRVTGILTLLLLTLFTGAIALGAQSFVAAIVAFFFFAGALAVATAAQAQSFYSASPPETGPPLEDVADLRIDDIQIDEDDDGEVNSVDALHRSFDKRDDDTAKPDDPPDPESPSSRDTSAKDSEKESGSTSDDDLAATAPTETVGDNTAADNTAATSPDDDSAPAPDDEVTATSPDDTAAAAADDIPQRQTRVFVAGAATTSASPSPTDDPEPPDDSNAAAPVPQQRDGSTPTAFEDDGQQATTEPPDVAPPAQADHTAPKASDIAADGDDEPAEKTTPGPAAYDTDSAPTAATTEDDGDDDSAVSKTALSLLAAETPGTNLLAAYTSSNLSVPPETVRDVAATLIVSNLDRSIMFYTELLGLVEIDRAPDAVLLEAGFGRVLLWRRDDAPGAGDPVMHLTFEVGDIDKAYQSLGAKGVRFTHPPVSALSGEIHDLRAASFLDPDGHGLAITQLREH